MVTLTREQKEIRQRIQSSIDREIGMCDDYADLMILASALYDSSKLIMENYTANYEIEEDIVEIKDINSDPNPCLLYTAPSPRDGLLSRMPSSA